jgi:hypothetical protein
MDQQEFFDAVASCLAEHGGNAAKISLAQSEAFLERGDIIGCSQWIAIASAIEELANPMIREAASHAETLDRNMTAQAERLSRMA